MESLLTSLRRARWQAAFRTYGNDHATLLGLLVDWWISAAPRARWALDEGPSFGYHARGVGSERCDVVLGEGATSRGLIEVEGRRYVSTIDKFGKFFSSAYVEFQTLEFGIFLAYAYQAVGSAGQRHLPSLPFETFVERARAVTVAHPGKQLVILTLDKTYERVSEGPRKRNEYYWGRPSATRGALVEAGQVARGDFHIRAEDVLGHAEVNASHANAAPR